MTRGLLRAFRIGHGRLAPAGLVLLLTAASGCSPSAPRGARFWANSYAFGTLGEQNFDTRDLCGEEAPQRVEVLSTPSTVLLSLVTLGLYTPHEVQVQCR